jgi:hypothetical protein
MATLRHLQTGADVPLAARHVVGRSRSCQLQIDAANVSALHAEIAWDSQVWHLRDLGSRNGTFVAGHRMQPGQQVALDPGTEISFGASDRQYRLIDASAPRLIAFGPDQIRVADDDVLCLPSPADWEAMIFRDADERWVIETADGTRPLQDVDCVVVKGRPYTVHLPGPVPATRDVRHLGEDALARGTLEFLVSRDGEHVDLRLRDSEHVHPIESRAHVLLLLALARNRVADAANPELPQSEHGWMYREDLMKDLEIDDPQLLNLWVFRARQQFTQLKLRDAAKIVERREGTGQLRLGLRRVLVIPA